MFFCTGYITLFCLMENSVSFYINLLCMTTSHNCYLPWAQLTSLFLSILPSAAKANGDFLNKQHRHLVELAAKGSLPLHPVRMEHVEPTASYVTEVPCLKQNGQKPKSIKAHVAHPAMAYSSNTIANPGMLRSWENAETAGRRKTYGPRKMCTVEQVNELHTARSHHYLPTQPYFVTNSKTEVTV